MWHRKKKKYRSKTNSHNVRTSPTLNEEMRKKKQQGTEDRGCKMEDAGGGVKSSKWSGR